MIKIFLFLIPFFTVLSCQKEKLVLPAPEADFELVIFHTDDIRGHALIPKTLFAPKTISYADIAAYINRFKQRQPYTLLIDAGNTIQGNLTANLSQGEAVIDIMNLTGYDAMVPGNHEFDWGVRQTAALAQRALFPIVAANLVSSSGKYPFKPYVIKNINNVRVAVIGLTTPQVLYKTTPSGLRGYKSLSPDEALGTLLPRLKDEADVIIAISHLGSEGYFTSQALAEHIGAVDLIIDGHNNNPSQSVFFNHTLVTANGEHGKTLGKITLSIKNKKVVAKKAEVIRPLAFITTLPDITVQRAIYQILDKKKSLLQEVIGSIPVNLDYDKKTIRIKETLLGQLVADCLRSETRADIAFINGGAFRAGLAAGPVTKAQVFEVLPFEDTVRTAEVSGLIIKEVLEQSLALYPKANGGFLQTSGLKFTVDASKPAGSRISDIKVNGEPLYMQSAYTVAALSFLLEGGDGYNMLIGAPRTGQFTTPVEIFTEYLQNMQKVPVLQNHITWIN
jgi:5'-nucleotidase/UDP-sugar diphosphatase